MGRHGHSPRSLPRRLAGAALVIWLLISLAGCNNYLLEFYFGDLFSSGKKTEKSPQQLAMEGVQKMQEKDYGDAVKAFQQLKERYPYSKYAILAELKLADAYYQNGEYSEAAVAYEEFARLHPRNEVIPYVLYQIGMCHFLSFESVDTDQEETRLAVDAFQRLVQAFPQSEYSAKARQQLLECRKRLAFHEFLVARFYYRTEKYVAAKERLDFLTARYPEAVPALGLQDEVQVMLAECERELGRPEAKASIWMRIGL
jgi:outer membrane protein assembly factor BamD